MKNNEVDDNEVLIINETKSVSDTNTANKKRQRESYEMPNTPRSPSKRTRKNSLGAGNAGAAGAAAAAAAAAASAAASSTAAGPGASGVGAAGGGATGASASPAGGPDTTRKPSSVPGMDEATMLFLVSMEQRLSGQINNITDKVNANTEGIKSLREEQDAMKKEMGRKLDKQKKETRDEIERALAGVGVGVGRSGLTRQQEEAYDLHRRSLLCWPIKGPNYPNAIRSFLVDKLKFSADFLVDMGHVDVKKFFDSKPPPSKARAPDPGSSAPPKDEVIVTFSSRECRDKVKAAGIHLAGQTDAGIRIHVPGFLLDSFHALQAVGYHMKKRDPNLRRSVKFDDENRDLVMDVRVDGEWKRITSEQAKQAAKQSPDITVGPAKMSSADISKFLGAK